MVNNLQKRHNDHQDRNLQLPASPFMFLETPTNTESIGTSFSDDYQSSAAVLGSLDWFTNLSEGTGTRPIESSVLEDMNI